MVKEWEGKTAHFFSIALLVGWVTYKLCMINRNGQPMSISGDRINTFYGIFGLYVWETAMI